MALRRVFALVCFLSLLSVAATSAVAEDFYMKRASHTDPVTMGGQTQPARDDTTEIWISDAGAFTKTPQASVLVLKKEGTMYVLNDADKTYFEVPLAALGASQAAIDSMPPNPLAAAMGNVKVTVTPSDETKKIGKWNAKRYDLTLDMGMANSKSQYWVTNDLDVDPTIFTAMATVTMSMLPGYQDIVKEFEKMKGIPVETSTQVSAMGATVNTSDKMLEFAKKEAPEGMFKLPAGYKAVEMNPLMGRH
jgi:hypothetical protein